MYIKGPINFLRVPSIKTLTPVFGDKAKEARALLKGEVEPDTYEIVQDMIRNSYHTPAWIEQVFAALDVLAETFGVESLWEKGEIHARYMYLNTGDTYAATLVYDAENITVNVTSWGDIAERNPKLE